MRRDGTLPHHYFAHPVQVAQYNMFLNDWHQRGDKPTIFDATKVTQTECRQTECFEIHDVMHDV